MDVETRIDTLLSDLAEAATNQLEHLRLVEIVQARVNAAFDAAVDGVMCWAEGQADAAIEEIEREGFDR